MLGLGNTLSGGIVPAAAAVASFTDTKAITGITSSSTYLSSTSNMPQVFHHATADQTWTIVHTFDYDKDATHYTFGMGFASGKYYSHGYWGQNTQALIWTFMQGHVQGSGPGHMPVYNTDINASGKWTMTITKTGNTYEDLNVYINDGNAFDSGTSPTDIVPLYTSAPTSLTIGKSPHGGGFPAGGDKKMNDLAIFDGAFSDAEAAEAYNSGTTLDLRTHSRASDLAHYWMMGDGDDAGDGTGNADGTGDVIFDMAGSCDLTMTGINSDNIVEW